MLEARSKLRDEPPTSRQVAGPVAVQLPLAGIGVPEPELQAARESVNRDALRFAGFEVDAVEGYERVFREFTREFVFRAAEVDLRHLVARHRAGVRDVKFDDDAAFGSRLGLEVAVSEGGVAQAEAEGKLWRDFFLVEPAIADVDAL